MAFVDLSQYDLDQATAPKAVEANKEYELQILDCNKGTDKRGYDYIMPRYEVVGDPDAKDFTKFINLPTEGMDAKMLKKVLWALKEFCMAHQIDLSRTLDWEDDLPGMTCWAVLGKDEDEQWGEQNFIKKYVLPK